MSIVKSIICYDSDRLNHAFIEAFSGEDAIWTYRKGGEILHATYAEARNCAWWPIDPYYEEIDFDEDVSIWCGNDKVAYWDYEENIRNFDTWTTLSLSLGNIPLFELL